MAKFLIFILVVSCAATYGRVVYEDCGSGYELEEVNISGCDRSVPCYITLGEFRNVTASFTSLYASNSLTQNVNVILNNVQTSTVVSPNPCEATWCPVQSQVQAAYSAKLSLPTHLAITRGRLRWEIHNERGSNIICFEVVIETQVAPSDYDNAEDY